MGYQRSPNLRWLKVISMSIRCASEAFQRDFRRIHGGSIFFSEGLKPFQRCLSKRLLEPIDGRFAVHCNFQEHNFVYLAGTRLYMLLFACSLAKIIASSSFDRFPDLCPKKREAKCIMHKVDARNLHLKGRFRGIQETPIALVPETAPEISLNRS